MDRRSNENDNQRPQSHSSIDSDRTHTNQDDSEAISTREVLSGINSGLEEDISVAYERLTLGRPRTDWSGLCWDPELVQRNEDSDPQAADQPATQRPTATSTQAATSSQTGKSPEGAKPAQDKEKANPRIKSVIEEANERAEQEEEYFADQSSQSN